MHHFFWAIFVAVLITLTPGFALSAIVVALDEATLVERVDTVVLGTVLQTRSEVGPKGGIITRATVQVGRSLKGHKSVGEAFEVVVPGGVLPSGLGSHVAGSPSLNRGDMLVGFFENRDGYQVPWGLSFGVLRVTGNSHAGFRVSRDVRGLSLVGLSGEPVSLTSIAVQDEPLEVLWERLEHYGAQLRVLPESNQGGVR